jgi:cytochrome P450
MLSAEWCAHGFDHISPELAQNLHETLATMRANHPVAYSEEHGGFWVVTRYEDVLRVAQDWRTFSSARGVSVPETKMVVKAIPEHLDPPLHREYKRLINAWFTPAVVAGYEGPTRALVRLIDGFVDAGPATWPTSPAFPGLAFFDQVLNAPSQGGRAERRAPASVPNNPNARRLAACSAGSAVPRAAPPLQPPWGGMVGAVLAAEIEGRPIRETGHQGRQLSSWAGWRRPPGALARS